MNRYFILALLSSALVMQGTLSAEPKKVGPASQEAAKSAKRSKWISIGIAAAAVAVAVTVLVIVANNHDHHHHHHHRHDH